MVFVLVATKQKHSKQIYRDFISHTKPIKGARGTDGTFMLPDFPLIYL